jgi:hypothetical protein
MTEHPYQYVVLRCVPRVDRGEFLNVGVVLYSQAAEFLGCATYLDEHKLLSFAAELDLSFLQSALDAVATTCAGEGPAAATSRGQRFGWLAAPKSTMVQPGPVHGGLADDPNIELARLLDMLVR